MKIATFALSAASALFVVGAALAQTAPATQAPKTPPTPAVTAPKVPPTPAATPAAPAPKAAAPAPAAQTSLVNLNTGAESELDKLPQIGPARAKAIIEARTKGGRFKNWDDFVARNVVPKNAEDAIKDKVRF